MFVDTWRFAINGTVSGARKLGVSNGTPDSPVYLLGVRGVGATDDLFRLVRFAEQRAPATRWEVAWRLLLWNLIRTHRTRPLESPCMLVAGDDDEKGRHSLRHHSSNLC